MKKNYIILNGIRSDLINGLLISELPHVIKPKMRTQIEEIDGRDGAIITDLGYSAYNKEMIIGLYNDFDIDEVIEFFAVSGTAIFSNEPDKVYQYQIAEQIDFARLAHFRTATITFYVQPFKRSAVESAQTFNASTAYVVNAGNIESKPKITLYGTGTTTLSVNDIPVLNIALSNAYNKIIIDAEEMNAYNGDILLNRIVSGNYDDITLHPGRNVISCNGGSISKIEIDNYSRWI